MVFSFTQSFWGKEEITWELAQLVNNKSADRIVGNPEVIECKYGKAVRFNGSDDAVFLEDMPLSGLEEFTIEAIFKPESGGNFEQRFFHCGEIRGDRVLLEIRTTQTDWYFDGFVKSGDHQKTLIEPEFLHPIDQWYHVAYVADHGNLTTFINGQKELEGRIDFSPLEKGKTSIGVRLNEQSWFKGMIFKIRISRKALKINDFLKY